MTTRKFESKEYWQLVKSMRGPVSLKEYPKLKVAVNYRGMIEYADAKGLTVDDLTDDEKALFVEGGKTHLHEPGGWL